ncbi:hypothetical protein [Prescottella agglutinans]|uniref:hypothetical protein n=1 Tax=Prescottella agglutinans TaxID=1644129 RepID=UPI003D95E1A9
MGVAALAGANAQEVSAIRTGCTIDSINEPPSTKRSTLVKTSCGGLRSPRRSVTDGLQIGATYDFYVTERSTWFGRTTLIDSARLSP